MWESIRDEIGDIIISLPINSLISLIEVLPYGPPKNLSHFDQESFSRTQIIDIQLGLDETLNDIFLNV